MKKLMYCKVRVCPNGLGAISKVCDVCRHLGELDLGDIKGSLIEVTTDTEYRCYTNDKLPMHGVCPHGKKGADEFCASCIRWQQKVDYISTKVIIPEI